MRDRDRDRDWSAYRMGAGGAPVPPEEPIEDDFSGNLDKWTLEAPSGTISIVSGQMRIVSSATQYARAFYTARQIPATWETITITFKSAVISTVNNDFSAGLCMDDPPAGEPNTFGSAGTIMANGYACLFRPSSEGERVGRFHGSAVTVLVNANQLNYAADGALRVCTITFTKTPTAVLIDRTYDGGAVGTQISDDDANRKLGACYPFVAAYANGQRTEIDDFEVTWT